jgi:hypothetical protein
MLLGSFTGTDRGATSPSRYQITRTAEWVIPWLYGAQHASVVETLGDTPAERRRP